MVLFGLLSWFSISNIVLTEGSESDHYFIRSVTVCLYVSAYVTVESLPCYNVELPFCKDDLKPLPLHDCHHLMTNGGLKLRARGNDRFLRERTKRGLSTREKAY